MEESKTKKPAPNDNKKNQDIIDEKRVAKKNKVFHENLIAELKVKLKNAEDKLLRSLAENDNLRKRHEKEIEDNSKYAIKNFSYSLLTVADNLERAISSTAGESKEVTPVIKNLIIGIQAVEKELFSALEKNGVKKFESLHEKFNPELHQAVSKIINEKPEGIIVEEMQKGFKIGDRLLRPAMVVVSNGPEKK